MILTRQNVLHYLVQADHLGLDRIVNGDIQIVSRESRNRAFAVSDARGPGFFVKQHRPDEGHWSGGSTLESEAHIYALAAANDRLAALLPPFHSFDSEHQILVIGLVEPAETLRARHRRTGTLSLPAAEAIGHALATCHIEFGKTLRFGPPNASLAKHRPWILRPDRLDPHVTPSQSAAQARVISIVQDHPDLIDRLRALEPGWRVNGIIHGDMKWDNCLVTDAGASGDTTVTLVDWEMAGTGDVAWDVGGILQSCIIAWIRSTRPKSGDTAASIAASAEIPLSALQQTTRGFWNAYADHLDLDRRATATLLSSAVAYAAARIVQTAFEATSDDALVSAHMILALQFTANMLADPKAVAASLLGLAA
ncbi:aminoglycoside phosphotransferase family protein [Sphingomonas sp.]|uniref:aminoglycoside phosphotransferase family protein n=1 Tax=Sphingomonas sp. TaxID=28214 RepID=UPI003D6C9CCB